MTIVRDAITVVSNTIRPDLSLHQLHIMTPADPAHADGAIGSTMLSKAGGDMVTREGPSMPLHRVRFVDWAPSTITALAFLPLRLCAPASSSRIQRSLLAIGRDNGNIDLCVWIENDTQTIASVLGSNKNDAAPTSQPVAQGWMVDTTLVGSGHAKVETLAFVQTPTGVHPIPRLFSTSGGASVTEHFLPLHLLPNGRVPSSNISSAVSAASSSAQQAGTSRTIPSHGGSVWSMAASPLGKALAIGCDDGHVRIVDIDEGRFELQAPSRAARRGGDGTVRGIVSTLDRAKTRIVSLAWGPPRRRVDQQPARGQKGGDSSSTDNDDSDDDAEMWEDTFIVGGTTHSSALVWSLSTGRVESKLLVEKARKEQTIVWAVATLQNGTCVLGDSLGHVSFFDDKTRTLLAGGRFAAHGKRADVLALCVGPDGKSVYSGSVDQKVCEYAFVGGHGASELADEVNPKPKWIVTGKRRLHAHDIRAVAIDPPYDPRGHLRDGVLPVLVSGGTDLNVVMTPASPPSRIAGLTLSHASKKRLLKNGNKIQQQVLGLDTINPISTTPVTTFADTVQRRMSFVPTSGKGSLMGGGCVASICPARRWIILRREKSVAIWKLPDASFAEQHGNDDAGDETSWCKVLELQVKMQSNLVSVDVSPHGRYLVVADLYETKLFELQDVGKNTGDDVMPKRIKSLGTAFASKGLGYCPSYSAATFTPDGSRLVLASHPGSYIHVVELPARNQTAKCVLLKSFDDHRRYSAGNRAVVGRAHQQANGLANGVKSGVNGKLSGSESSDESDEENQDDEESRQTPRTLFARIDTIVVSPDGQYLVSVDTAQRIHTYSLDTLHYSAPLPSPSQRPSALVFNKWRSGRLCLLLPTNELIIYDLEARTNSKSGGASSLLGGATRSMGSTPRSNGQVNGSQNSTPIGNNKRSSGIISEDDAGLVAAVNQRIASVREGAIGGTWLNADAFLLWGSTWICTARRRTPEELALLPSAKYNQQQGSKRSRDAHEGGIAATNGTVASAVDEPTSNTDAVSASSSRSLWRTQLTFKYQPLLFVGLADPVEPRHKGTTAAPQQSELVVIERPYYDVARSMPPTYFGGAPYGS